MSEYPPRIKVESHRPKEIPEGAETLDAVIVDEGGELARRAHGVESRKDFLYDDASTIVAPYVGVHLTDSPRVAREPLPPSVTPNLTALNREPELLALPPMEERADPTRLTVGIVDQSADVRHAARDEADRRLETELSEGGRVKRFANAIWKGNIAKDYFRQKYIFEAEELIKETNDIYIYEEGDAGVRRRAQLATIERFQSEYDETLHSSIGERRKDIENPELTGAIKDLIRRNVNGELSDDALVEERTRMLAAFSETRESEVLGEGIVQVDNMLEIAQAVKGAIAHGESLDAVLENMRFVTGEARSGVRTEARLTKLDKAIEKLTQSKVGLLVNPETIVASASIAYSAARWSSQSALGAASRMVVPLVGAGVMAGIRENMRVKHERSQHAREMAQGREFAPGSKRREKMEETRYETAAARDLTQMLESIYGENADLNSEAAVRAALDALGVVETRIRMSDSQEEGVDLISYSNATSIEDERFALDLARAQAKTTLETRLDPATRQALGVEERASVDQLLDGPAMLIMETIQQDRTTKDEAFTKLKRRQVLLAGGTAMAFGAAAGGAFQEGLAALDDSRAGLIEEIWNSNSNNHAVDGVNHQTLLNRIAHGDVIHHTPSSTYVDYPIGDEGHISVSSEQSLVSNPDGTFTLTNADGNVLAERFTVNPDGSLPDTTLDTLRDSGVTPSDRSQIIDLPSTVAYQEVDLQNYMAEHQSDTTSVTRELPYDNNTPESIFENNETELRLGGDNGTGLTPDGGYQFDITTMTADGSYREGESVAWQEAAAAGELKLAISPSDAAQTQPIMIDIGPDGKPAIPPGSVAASFFSERDGQAVFNGKYAEVVQTTGVDQEGTTHIRPLATLVGTDTAKSGTFGIDQAVPSKQVSPDYVLTGPGYETPTVVEVPPVIPIVPRQPLGPTQRAESEPTLPAAPEGLPPVVPPTEILSNGRGSDDTPTMELPPVPPTPPRGLESAGGDTMPLPSAAVRYERERRPRTERVLPRSERLTPVVRHSALPPASVSEIPPSARPLPRGRDRGVSRRESGEPGSGERLSRTNNVPPATPPRGGSSPPTSTNARSSQKSKRERGFSPEDTERFVTRLEERLNRGSFSVIEAKSIADFHFGKDGYEIEGSDSEGYRIVVNDTGNERASRSRAEKKTLVEQERSRTT